MPPRYRWRAATSADLPALHATLTAVAVADSEPLPPPLADLERQFADSWAPPATHTRLALAPDGTVAAYGRLSADPSGAGAARAYLSDTVHPLHRAERLGDPLLDWLEAQGRVVLAGRPEPRTLNVHTPDHLTGRVAAYQRHGFTPSFTLLAQRRSLKLPLPAAPLPPGLRISVYQPEFDEALRQAQNEVFAEDPLQDQISPDDWRAYFVEHSAARLDLTYAVLAGAEVAAYLTTRVHAAANLRPGWTTAWVHTLGTRAPWRGRGLARHLLVTALAAYRAAGFDTATLQVESANSIAREFYARLGFVTFERSTEYVKVI